MGLTRPAESLAVLAAAPAKARLVELYDLRIGLRQEGHHPGEEIGGTYPVLLVD